MDNPIRIFLLEDDEDDYILFQESVLGITQFATKITWQTELTTAETFLPQNDHDIYFVDYNLGAKRGVDFIRQARSIGIEAPIVMLTGQNDLQTDREALAAGASDYLIKSELSSTLLERVIRYNIERVRNEQERRSLLLEQERLKETERATELIRQSEEHYRTIVENVRDYAIFTLKRMALLLLGIQEQSACLVTWNLRLSVSPLLGFLLLKILPQGYLQQ